MESGEYFFDGAHPYCVTRRHTLWLTDTFDEAIDYTQWHRTSADATLPLSTRHHFKDTEQTLYHTYRMIKTSSSSSSSSSSQSQTGFVPHHTLLHWLESLRVHQKLDCICPVFLGLCDNVTFLYDTAEARWIIMREPYVTRNESRVPLIESTLVYDAHFSWRNPLYNNYRRFTSQIMHEQAKQRHYASYEVSFREDAPVVDAKPVDDDATLQYRLYDTLLLQHDTVKKGLTAEDTRERTILMTMHMPGIGAHPRQRRVLSQQSAICFHFCDTANKRLII